MICVSIWWNNSINCSCNGPGLNTVKSTLWLNNFVTGFFVFLFFFKTAIKNRRTLTQLNMCSSKTVLIEQTLSISEKIYLSLWVLKTLDTIGNCPRPVFLTWCISTYAKKRRKKNCENFSTIGRRSCEIIMKEKTPLSHEVVCF